MCGVPKMKRRVVIDVRSFVDVLVAKNEKTSDGEALKRAGRLFWVKKNEYVNQT